MMQVHDRIRALREKEGINREMFAKKIGVTYAALSKYETGSRAPDYDTLIKIADYFNVTTDYLLGRNEIKNKPQKENLFPLDQLGITQQDFENLSTYQQEVLEWAVNADGLFFKNKADNVLDMMERLEIAYEVDKVMKMRKREK